LSEFEKRTEAVELDSRHHLPWKIGGITKDACKSGFNCEILLYWERFCSEAARIANLFAGNSKNERAKRDMYLNFVTYDLGQFLDFVVRSFFIKIGGEVISFVPTLEPDPEPEPAITAERKEPKEEKGEEGSNEEEKAEAVEPVRFEPERREDLSSIDSTDRLASIVEPLTDVHIKKINESLRISNNGD